MDTTMVTEVEPIGRATYSPEDNKLRLYPDARLDKETYNRVKAMGFGWAPKQGLFVAPAWSPGRYDLLVILCGEVGDEETTLQERAEQRAERFAKYKANRHRDAHYAADRVAELTENVPLGQPILVGHHSQHAAERQAKKIERAMETAVDQWSRHEYWKRRIPAVLAHAEYKGNEALRHRRIKGIESDLRKVEKEMKELEQQLAKWNTEGLTLEQARHFANYSPYGCKLNCAKSPHGHYYSEYDVLQPDGERYTPCPAMTVEQVVEIANDQLPYRMRGRQRWIDHYKLRLAYEGELMEQAGGDIRDRFAHVEVGGKVQIHRRFSRGETEWVTIQRVNKVNGRVCSLRTTAPIGERWFPLVQVENILAYEAPSELDKQSVKKANKLPPMVNYPGEGFKHMKSAEWMRLYADYKGSRVVAETELHGKHRVRCEYGGMRGGELVYLTDKKLVEPPIKKVEPVVEPEPIVPALQFDLEPGELTRAVQADRVEPEASESTPFDAMKKALKSGGVQIAVAHQLYPTPPAIAERMVELAQIENGMCVLEPSAGTGNLVQAVRDKHDTEVLAYEINNALCSGLGRRFQSYECHVEQGDFLEVEQKYRYPRILMNPPFEKGADIKHILRALEWLDDGGRLVGICANGPRQQNKIMPLCTMWEELPSGTFEGTGVRTALFVIDK